jgi:hypothetical protein
LTLYILLQITLKEWNDREKKGKPTTVQLLCCSEYSHQGLFYYFEYNGWILYITFDGKAVSILEKQFQLIKSLLDQNIETEVLHMRIQKGTKVEIKVDPLLGLTGELIDYANNKSVVLRIEEIDKALLVK